MTDNGTPPTEDVQSAIPPIDPGNLDVLNPRHDIQVTRGFIRRIDGTTLYVLTFRQGVSTFTLPFHGGAEAMLGFANMLIEDAKNTTRPSGLIVPQAGTPIPTNLRRR